MKRRQVQALWNGGGLEDVGRVEGRWLMGRMDEAAAAEAAEEEGRGGVRPRKVGGGLAREEGSVGVEVVVEGTVGECFGED